MKITTKIRASVFLFRALSIYVVYRGRAKKKICRVLVHILEPKALKWAPYHTPGIRLHDFCKISKKTGFLLFWTPKVARTQNFIGCPKSPNDCASFGKKIFFKKVGEKKVISVLRFSGF